MSQSRTVRYQFGKDRPANNDVYFLVTSEGVEVPLNYQRFSRVHLISALILPGVYWWIAIRGKCVREMAVITLVKTEAGHVYREQSLEIHKKTTRELLDSSDNLGVRPPKLKQIFVQNQVKP